VNALFCLRGAVRGDPETDRWFDDRPPDLAAITREWFLRMRQCGDDVVEMIHDGCPVACVEDAAFAYVNAFKAHVNVGFFHGVDLPDPARLLEGSGKRMRHVKLRPGTEIDAEALDALIKAAYADVKRRLATGAP
jgi:hypothetical protein